MNQDQLTITTTTALIADRCTDDELIMVMNAIQLDWPIPEDNPAYEKVESILDHEGKMLKWNVEPFKVLASQRLGTTFF